MLQVKDRQGSTSLHIAATHGHFEMCQVLLGQGADCTVEDREQWTALHCAAKGGYLDVVHLLTNSGTSTTATTSAEKVTLSSYRVRIISISRFLSGTRARS